MSLFDCCVMPRQKRAVQGFRVMPLAFCVCLLLLLAGPASAQDGDAASVTPDWDTPKAFEDVSPHPRLYITRDRLERAVAGRERFTDLYDTIERAARTGLRDAEEPMAEIGDMRRQVYMPARLTAMALQYHRTGDKRYIEASVRNIENMESWFEPAKLWQLWHGGFSTAIAINYDLLHNDMTPEQRQRVVTFAREHVIRPFLRRTARGKNMKEHGERGSWWQNIISNWNPVCNAGPGMLALAMYDDLDEAQTVIDRVNASLQPIIDELQETNGGWVEGLGYWNWTMHYMSLFYMSYENTSGRHHAGFRSPGFKGTLTFVDYFVPYDRAVGFGDNQHGGISNSLLAAAEHLGYDDTLRQLQRYFQRKEQVAAEKRAIRAKRDGERAEPQATEQEADDPDAPVNISYGLVNKVMLRPDLRIDETPAPPRQDISVFYDKPGWGAMADRWPMPNAYVAYRAGQLGGAHTQHDLLTWHGAVGGEVMIRNINSGHVSQNSYGSRRNELYEVNSRSKNTLLVGGLGPYRGGKRGGMAKANTTLHELATGPMSLNEATRAFNTTRNRPVYVARAFVIIKDRGVLVLDRVIAPRGKGQPVEARAYTPHDATFGETDVLIEGEFETARMTFASNVDATLTRAVALMTFPKPDPPTMLRWQTNGSEKSTVMASLLSRGSAPVELAVATEGEDENVVVTIRGDGWDETMRLTSRLEPMQSDGAAP